MSADETRAALMVDELTVRYPGETAAVLDGVGFRIDRGRRIAVVGGSGAGKSTLALALLGLLPEGAMTTGSAALGETPLIPGDERSWMRIRGDRIALVFQNPMVALDPRRRIGRQLHGLLRIHDRRPAAELRAECVRLLERVGIHDPGGALRRFPHELSGGMLQRVMIALAVASRPEVLIADEPTTALDATSQLAVLELLAVETARVGSSLLLITHNLAVARGFCDEVIVLDGGRVVEQGPVGRVLASPSSAAARRLIDAIPVMS